MIALLSVDTKYSINFQVRKWARQFEVKENDSSKDKQSKKRGAVIEAGNQGLSGAKWRK